MRIAIGLLIAGVAGCSNAPIAGTMDCLMPSKAGRGSTGGGRPPDEYRLPSPELPTRPVEPRRDFPTGREAQPRIDENWRRPTGGSGNDLPDYDKPLPAPNLPRN